MAKLMSEREKNKGIWTEDPTDIATILIEERGLSEIKSIFGDVNHRIIKVAESITKDEAIEYVVQHEKI